jgi:hypothetical protein
VPKEKHDFNGIVIYIMWNLWKERNWCIFQNEGPSSLSVANSAKADI